VLCASLGALAITALMWPIAAIVRRRYGATLALDPYSLRAYRLSKIAAILILAALGTWALTLARMIKDINNLGSTFDAAVHFAQLFGLIIFIGGFGSMLWNLWTVWSGARRWPAKVWSIVLTLAAFMVLWVAVAFNLISFGVLY
jgi:hypothetical protein